MFWISAREGFHWINQANIEKLQSIGVGLGRTRLPPNTATTRTKKKIKSGTSEKTSYLICGAKRTNDGFV
jgi:hypothetical protein